MNLKFAMLGAGFAVALSACSPAQLVQSRVERTMDRTINEAVNAMEQSNDIKPAQLRVATYNTSLFDDKARGLIDRLQRGDAEAQKIAAVIQTVRPDVVLLNEFDYDAQGEAADLFQKNYLARAQFGQNAIEYPYRYFAEVNTGVPSGLDLDGNGQVGGEGRNAGNDAWGYGLHPGQYGMLVLSKYPIDTANVRTFRKLKWSTIPQAMQPIDPKTNQPYYKPDVWSQLRISSKSHWDVPIQVGAKTFHLLAAHPTPPVFDGPEDRNGKRNYDEIRLWREYLNNAAGNTWLCDDNQRCGGLRSDAAFVIVGDYNADPIDGDGVPNAINQLLNHPRAATNNAPRSLGAIETAAAYGYKRKGDVSMHTGDFGKNNGTLRLDYVIPSKQFRIDGQGVFWPTSPDAAAKYASASDHHMVWMDLSL